MVFFFQTSDRKSPWHATGLRARTWLYHSILLTAGKTAHLHIFNATNDVVWDFLLFPLERGREGGGGGGGGGWGKVKLKFLIKGFIYYFIMWVLFLAVSAH